MIDREYNFEDNADVLHKDVKMYYDTNQFLTLLFCGSHPKPQGTTGLGNIFYILFNTNLGHGICVICRIPCAYVEFTSMLDKPWISGV